MFIARLRAAESGRAVSDGANAQPNASGQRRSQRKDARVAQSAARPLERGGQVPTTCHHRAQTAGRHRQAEQRRSLPVSQEEDFQPQQQDGQPQHQLQQKRADHIDKR